MEPVNELMEPMAVVIPADLFDRIVQEAIQALQNPHHPYGVLMWQEMQADMLRQIQQQRAVTLRRSETR